MNLFDLTGKKAIVTGGCQGLGKSMAEGLAEAGAKVCLMDLNPETKQIAEKMSTESGTFCGVVVNLLDREDLARGFQEAVDELGGLDILINNAGMQVRGNAEEIELSRWDKLIELNLTAVFEMSQLAARHMLQSGGGKIINVASMLSFFGGYVCSPYAASKGAVAQLTKAFSNEWAGKGINVNAEGKLCGDVDFEKAEPIVDAITPVPGGVGSVTTSVLVGHVVEAAKRKYL